MICNRKSIAVLTAFLLSIPISAMSPGLGLGAEQASLWLYIGPPAKTSDESPFIRGLACANKNGVCLVYAALEWYKEPYQIDQTIIVDRAGSGLYLWSEDTKSWRLMLYGGETVFTSIYSLAVDPNNSSVIYVGLGFSKIGKSTDDGLTWHTYDLPDEPGGFTEVLVSQANSSIVYAGTYNGLFKSQDGGKSWHLLQNGILTRGFVAWAVAESPDGETTYVGGEDQHEALEKEGGRHVPRLFRSLDGGDAWQEISIPFWHPLDIDFDPADPRTVYVATEGTGLWVSNNLGENWERIGGGLSSPDITQILFDPKSSNIMYAATLSYFGGPGGVFRSSDRGRTWSHIGNGLRGNETASLVIDSSGKVLYAATIFSPSPDFRPSGLNRLIELSPYVEFRSDREAGGAPLTVNFCAEITGGEPPYNIRWEFGDGAFSLGQKNVTHTYQWPGKYGPRITVTDAQGNVDSAYKEISVDPLVTTKTEEITRELTQTLISLKEVTATIRSTQTFTMLKEDTRSVTVVQHRTIEKTSTIETTRISDIALSAMIPSAIITAILVGLMRRSKKAT